MARVIPLVLVLFLGSALGQDDIGAIPRPEPPVFALTGATVVVGDGRVLTDTTVVVSHGMIEAIGSGISVPPGAWEVDLAGMFIYPGLIDSLTENGFRKASGGGQQRPAGPSGRQSQSGGGESADQEGPGYFAHVSAADMLEIDRADDWRRSGVLSWHVAPDQGIFRGRTAVVNVGWDDADSSIIRSDVALKMAYQTLGFRTYPGSLMGVIAHMRQTLLDAQHYRKAWAVYSQNPRGLKRPETDRTLEALQPVIEGKLPLIFPAAREREIRRSVSLASEFDAGCIIAGGFEAPAAAELLKQKQIPVLVSLKYPPKPRDPHPEDEETVDALRYRLDAPRAAARLHEAGVRFAFYSDGANARDFLQNLRKAVEEGLPKEAALKAASLTAAQILGVSEQLGSVEPGKIANLVVADADLFDKDAQIRHVFVDGVHEEFPAKAKNAPTAGGDVAGIDMSGSWSVSIQTPGGNQSMTFNLQQQAADLSGDVTSDMGTTSIYDGSVSGQDFSFKIEFDMQGNTAVVSFSGTVSGDSLSGTATLAGMGSAPMEGSRIP